MQCGNWVPICKAFLKSLPKDRPFTELEAAFSVQVDYDDCNPVTISGYSALWQWSRKKVRNFLNRIGVEIIYPADTKKVQKQKGQIRLQDRSRKRAEKSQIRLIDSKWLQDERDRNGPETGQKEDRSGSTTSYPDQDPDISNLSVTCPQYQIVDLYHSILPELPKVRIWSEKRQAALRARWKAAAKSRDGLKSNCIEWWEGFFKYIRESDFLMGNAHPNPGRKPFEADLEWIVKSENFVKILEGKYHRRRE